jgi:hypothetical protein
MSHLQVDYEKFIIDLKKHLEKKKPQALEFTMIWLRKKKIKANPWDTIIVARKLDKELNNKLKSPLLTSPIDIFNEHLKP